MGQRIQRHLPKRAPAHDTVWLPLCLVVRRHNLHLWPLQAGWCAHHAAGRAVALGVIDHGAAQGRPLPPLCTVKAGTPQCLACRRRCMVCRAGGQVCVTACAPCLATCLNRCCNGGQPRLPCMCCTAGFVASAPTYPCPASPPPPPSPARPQPPPPASLPASLPIACWGKRNGLFKGEQVK